MDNINFFYSVRLSQVDSTIFISENLLTRSIKTISIILGASPRIIIPLTQGLNIGVSAHLNRVNMVEQGELKLVAVSVRRQSGIQ